GSSAIRWRIRTDGYRQKHLKNRGLVNGGERWRTSFWRREWDSNPRYGFPYTRFPSVRLKPLGHPSENCCNAGNITLHARVRNPLRARGRVRPRERKRSIHAAHVARVAHVIAGEFAGAFAERRGADEFEQRLQGRQEIVALAQREIEALPCERHEAEPGCLRDRARRDPAVSATGAYRLRDIGAGRADRPHQGQRVERDAGAGHEREQKQLRTRALRPRRQPRALGGDASNIAQLQWIARRDHEPLLAARNCDDDRVVKPCSTAA